MYKFSSTIQIIDINPYVRVPNNVLQKLQRIFPMPQKLVEAFSENKKAREAFDRLSPSRQKEIIRYLGSLESEEAIKRNIEKVIKLLITN